jgi:hypothetical protein
MTSKHDMTITDLYERSAIKVGQMSFIIQFLDVSVVS